MLILDPWENFQIKKTVILSYTEKEKTLLTVVKIQAQQNRNRQSKWNNI